MPDYETGYDPSQPVYMRVGDWHASETSKNYSIGDTEAGVSAYDLTPDGSIVIPPDGEYSALELRRRLKQDQPRHLIQGDWVGCGGEGEPLLRNVVLVGSWPDDLPRGFRSSIVELTDETVLSIEDAFPQPRLAEPSKSVIPKM